jgi:hypothetical protein
MNFYAVEPRLVDGVIRRLGVKLDVLGYFREG